MSYPVAFFVSENGTEKYLARDLNDDFTFVTDMFAPDVVQAQNDDDEQKTIAEYKESGLDGQLKTKSFPGSL